MLLECEGVDINTKDEHGRTPLCWASAGGHEDVVALLFKRGADSNSSAEAGETPLSIAAQNGNLSIVTMFLSWARVDPDSRDGSGCTPLSWAAELNHPEIAERLLATGSVNVNSRNKNGETPLLLATRNGNDSVVALLLAVPDVEPDCRDQKGRTPLSLAAEAGFLGIVERFLPLDRVLPDARDDTGRTALSWAVTSDTRWRGWKDTNREGVVRRLLRVKAVDPNAEDEAGWTPLSWAVQGHEGSNFVEILLAHGAGRIDLDYEDRKGRTPLALALECGHEVIAGQLRAAGATLKPMTRSVGKGADDEQLRIVDIGREEQRQGLGKLPMDDDGQAYEDEINAKDDGGDPGSPPMVTEPRDDDDERFGSRMNSDWSDDMSSSDDSIYQREALGDLEEVFWLQTAARMAKEVHIELGAQVVGDYRDVRGGGKGDEELLCQRCDALDLDALFSNVPSTSLG